MINFEYKKIIIKIFLVVSFIILLPSLSYANTYSNNSIEIEVTPERRSYDYGDNVSLDINIKNKNRYAKLYYKITEIYSGGGFETLNISNSEEEINELSNSNLSVELKDKYYKETNDKNIDTHITFNNGYFNGKGKMNIGRNAYEITKEEYDEFARYRNEKVVGEKIGSGEKEHFDKEELEKAKSQINATFLIIIIVLLIIVIIIIFIWFIIKSKGSGGSSFKLIVLMLSVSILLNTINNRNTYAADIYQENIKYNKTVSTQVGYSMFNCTFDVKIEYYFVNTIAPITDLEIDTDNDTLSDYIEVLYLTDFYNEDTDGDGLSDGIEVYKTYTDPLRVDTDNNGINDGDEDYDKDKLTNIEEKNYGTDYDHVDTDFDSISDYDEINGVKTKDGLKTYKTNPLSDDTDGDGLRDDTELKLNLNPLNSGDANTKVKQTINKSVLPKELTIESSTPISFTGELIGDIDENVKVRKSHNYYFDIMEGIVGTPIKIDTTYIYHDNLMIEYDLTKYESIKNRIQLCRYSEGKLVPVEYTFIENNKLYGNVQSGEYVLIDSKRYMNMLKIYLK